MQVEIVTIGNEVLSGRTLDTNFPQIARALEEVSVQVGWHTTVSDTVERIAEALRLALSRADAVVMTGGLGPTPDDLTRKAVVTFTLRTAGTYESKLQERIAGLPQHWPGAALAYLPSYFGVDLRVTVAGGDPDSTVRVAEQAYEELRAVVAPVLYAEGTRTME